MSVLDAMKSLEYIRLFAADSFDLLTNLVLRRTRGTLTFESSTKIATTVTRALVHPLFSKFDPIQVGEYYRLLTLSKEYGSRLLAESYKGMEPDARERLLSKITDEYPAHSFVIDFKEATELGLNVRQPSAAELAILQLCVTLFRTEFEDVVEVFDTTASPPPGAPNTGVPQQSP